MVFKSDKFILIKNEMFVKKKGIYVMNFFKVNVINIVTKYENNNKNASLSYLLKSCDIWHLV